VTGQRWRLTPDELGVIWPHVGVARLPFPFDHRPWATTVDEQRAVDAAARARLAAGRVLAGNRLDPDLHSVLLALARPRSWIDAVGYVGDRPQDLVRVLAARSGTVGVLAVQLSGRAEDVGGDLLLETVPATALAAALVAALPPAPPGRSPAVRVLAGDGDPEQDGSVVRSVRPTAAQAAAQQLAALTGGPLVGAGQISAGAVAPGGRTLRESHVRWFDRAGDGRYLMLQEVAVTVAPATSAELVTATSEQLAGLLRKV
jgi:hypothetical protein